MNLPNAVHFCIKYWYYLLVNNRRLSTDAHDPLLYPVAARFTVKHQSVRIYVWRKAP